MAGASETPQQLVVIGSSAGGIDALSTLVSTLSPSFPAPIIVAQHLDPSRFSHLQEILARKVLAEFEDGRRVIVAADEILTKL